MVDDDSLFGLRDIYNQLLSVRAELRDAECRIDVLLDATNKIIKEAR